MSEGEQSECIRAVSAVLRLGRAEALTDHSSVLFNVDISTGEIGRGTTNSHWYRLGSAAYQCPWLPSPDISSHPDSPFPQVSGKIVPSMSDALSIVCGAHYSMMRDVPVVGWDVAFTTEGVCLLEVNLSCNFFRGIFDIPAHIDFVSKYFEHIEASGSIGGVSEEKED
jgi:Sugar-transfer associated ATP-grasp